jgi:hypothetical protein
MRQTELRLQRKATPLARRLLPLDGLHRRKENHEDDQQGDGAGVSAADSELPEVAAEDRKVGARIHHRCSMGTRSQGIKEGKETLSYPRGDICG